MTGHCAGLLNRPLGPSILWIFWCVYSKWKYILIWRLGLESEYWVRLAFVVFSFKISCSFQPFLFDVNWGQGLLFHLIPRNVMIELTATPFQNDILKMWIVMLPQLNKQSSQAVKKCNAPFIIIRLGACHESWSITFERALSVTG